MRRRTFFLLLLMLLLAVPVVGLVAVHLVDGGYWRGLIADRVEASTGRKLNLGGPFAFTWSLSPSLSLEAVSLANAPGAATPNMLRIGRIEVQLQLWSLLGRQPDIEQLILQDVELDLERDAHGVGNWQLTPAAGQVGSAATEGGAAAPILRQAVIEHAIIRYRGGLGEITEIMVEHGRLDGLAAETSARLEIVGTLDGIPMGLSGNLARVGEVLMGDVAQADLSDLRFRLGDDVLTGVAKLNWAPEQSMLHADLASERLELATFLDLQGTMPDKRAAGTQGTLDALTSLDADVRLQVAALLVHGFEVKGVKAEGRLRTGRLTMEPLSFEFAGSPVHGSLVLDGGSRPQRVAAEAAADGLDVGDLLAKLGIARLVEGHGDLRLELRGSGQALRDWRADSEGNLRFLMSRGQLGSQLADQLAGGLRQLLGALTGGNAGPTTPIRCAALNAPVAKGIMHPDLILDTEHTTLVAHGTVDLRRNRLDLVLSPQAKSPNLNVAVPVTVRGPIADPSFGLDDGDAARRLASLLGSVVFPPAAIGAFVDFGSASSNGCLELAANPKQPAPAAAPSVDSAIDAVKEQVEGAGRKLLDLLTPSP